MSMKQSSTYSRRSGAAEAPSGPAGPKGAETHTAVAGFSAPPAMNLSCTPAPLPARRLVFNTVRTHIPTRTMESRHVQFKLSSLSTS